MTLFRLWYVYVVSCDIVLLNMVYNSRRQIQTINYINSYRKRHTHSYRLSKRKKKKRAVLLSALILFWIYFDDNLCLHSINAYPNTLFIVLIYIFSNWIEEWIQKYKNSRLLILIFMYWISMWFLWFCGQCILCLLQLDNTDCFRGCRKTNEKKKQLRIAVKEISKFYFLNKTVRQFCFHEAHILQLPST